MFCCVYRYCIRPEVTTCLLAEHPRGVEAENDDCIGWKLSLLRRMDADDARVQKFDLLQCGLEYSVVTTRRDRQHVWIYRRTTLRPQSTLVSTTLFSYWFNWFN